MMILLLLWGCDNAPTPVADDHPTRVLSLDVCADQYVVSLLPADRIIAVSQYATADYSYAADRAEGLRQHRARAEEILALQPDLVIRSYGGGDILPHLKKAGIPVIEVGYPTSFGDAREALRRVAHDLGADKKANMLLLSSPSPYRPNGKTALYLTPSGVTAGRGTMIDDVITAAGYKNYETRSFWPSIPLERMAQLSPDLIVTAFYDTGYGQVTAWSTAHHPVAQKSLNNTAHITLPAALTTCNAWYMEEAISLLAEGEARQ